MSEQTQDHNHAWGPIRSARYGTAAIRDCRCGFVLAYEDEDDYPLNLDESLFTPDQLARQLETFEVAERLRYYREVIDGKVHTDDGYDSPLDLSYGEILDLQDLGQRGFIPDYDVELRQWAGLPEFENEVQA